MHTSELADGISPERAYSWNGVGRMVREDFEEPGVRLDYGRMASHSPWKNARRSILHYSYADGLGRQITSRPSRSGNSGNAAVGSAWYQ